MTGNDAVNATRGLRVGFGSPTVEQGSLAEKLAARRDLAPMTVSCGVDGCEWPGFEGSAVECREAAAAHRREAHPGLRDRGQVTRQRQAREGQAKPKPVQSAEDRRLVAAIESRRRKPRPVKRSGGGRRVSLLTPERRREATELNQQGWSTWRIAAGRFEEWGYASAMSCYKSLRTAMAAELLRSPAYGRLTDERLAACRRLFDAGIGVAAIAELVHARFGYDQVDSCRSVLTQRLRKAGAELGRPRPPVPELNRAEAEQILDDLERRLGEAA